MPNGGFWGRIKTGLGLVKQTKNWGEQKAEINVKDQMITLYLAVKVSNSLDLRQ